MNPKAKLTLVGAGPGDPELITLKGINALKSADVILYDALINPVLLEHAPQAIKIFVGKRKGFHRYTQDEINQKIVENAYEHGHVVRLKGGDPFVFGRGSEEIDYVENYGLHTDIVPGISSSIAVPSSIGIPLTKRGVSESFWVITGCTSSRELSSDVRLAAQSSATVVILMGMNKLSQIVSIFKELDKEDTPVAIIQNGTLENQNSGIGEMSTIEDVVKTKNLSSPAIIVIGEVVKNNNEIQKLQENLELHLAS
ncbi:uroporphyrinogen-III C-methyltransferase [Lutimonas halocynthiae]|uniref:uroporphyrinogen-III C-methyltransferase n=1 Tax=Lutimonas halocynthiae TaxID=1446477 RepID=UPI0025B4C314|nr:uroporphyrinogen-III C-methyltransferase [Lutimonas halocynthiae]MDN3642402.1 uroporphyrinogen-III C-methyltransferase [Lutimonas halocynthiae]